MLYQFSDLQWKHIGEEIAANKFGKKNQVLKMS